MRPNREHQRRDDLADVGTLFVEPPVHLLDDAAMAFGQELDVVCRALESDPELRTHAFQFRLDSVDPRLEPREPTDLTILKFRDIPTKRVLTGL